MHQIPILQALRTGTTDIHERLDASLPLTSDRLDATTYLDILGCLHTIQATADHALAPWAAALTRLGYDPNSRYEVVWLDEDFAWWNEHRGLNTTHDHAQHVPEQIDSVSEALGWIYVLEGSTLGGQVILRHVAKALDLDPPHGCRYFTSHGADVGARWRRTCQSIEAAASAWTDDARDTETQNMVRAARSLFARIDMMLNPSPV